MKGGKGDVDRCESLSTEYDFRGVRPRVAPTSKVHVVVDANGLPVRLGLTPGEAHDNRLCSVLLAGLRPQTIVLADRGYDADWIRQFVREQGAWGDYQESCV